MQVAAEQAAIEPSPTEVAKRVAHYQKLRAKWRPWALKNKELLQRMLHSEANDLRALKLVYKATPISPIIETAGFSIVELNGSEKVSYFTWEPITKMNKDKRRIDRAAQVMSEHFVLLHDFKLSVSNNKGRSNTSFWVTGRITEQKWIDNPNGNLPDQPALIRGPIEEIEPLYDFLLK